MRVNVCCISKEMTKAVADFYLRRITWAEIGKRQEIYVWDWSVSSDPIFSWDVNYTVLSLHVKSKIIEEGKRCATFYLCLHFELAAYKRSLTHFPLSLFTFLDPFYLLYSNVILSELITLQRYYSQSSPLRDAFVWTLLGCCWAVCVPVLGLGACGTVPHCPQYRNHPQAQYSVVPTEPKADKM